MTRSRRFGIYFLAAVCGVWIGTVLALAGVTL
jgi:hypothetical protein